MTRADFKHFYDLVVRWADMDALGHVNNAELVRYFECGRVAYFADVFQIGFKNEAGEAWILAELSCTFHQQLQFPETVTVATRCSRLGRSSAELTAAVFRQTGEELFASSRAVIVRFDYQQQKSVPISAELRNRVKTYEVVAPVER